MTASELAKLVGMTATMRLHVGGIAWTMAEVKILDARDAYGRTDLLVEPVSGTGTAWVSADRVKVRKENR